MNKTKVLLLVSLLVTLISCVRDVYLDPFEFPDQLNREIFRVESFTDSAFFAVTNEAVFYKYGDQDWRTDDLLESGLATTEEPWQDASIVYKNGSVFCGFSNTYSITNEVETKSGKFQFMQRATVTITPDNEFLRVGFGLIDFDPNENFERYYIYFERVEGDSTVLIPTDMMVKSTNLGDVNVTYNADGDMVISTNPVFIVSSWDEDNVSYQTIEPTSGVTSFKSISKPNVVGDMLYGYNSTPKRDNPVALFYSFNLNTGEVQSAGPSLYCDNDENSLGLTKHLDWNGSEAILYHRTISTQASGAYDNLGYIQYYNFQTNSCNREVITPSNLLKYTSSINDVGFHKDSPEILLGSQTQLYQYDIESASTQPYVQTLLDL